jgi:zinc transporter
MEGLIDGWMLDGDGGAEDIRERLDSALDRPEGVIWLHLDRLAPGIETFLQERLAIDPMIVEALLAEDTRPRCDTYHEGLLLNLRGVNLNPGANPEDMLSVRIWSAGNFIVSLRKLKLMSIDDIRMRLRRGDGPRNAAEVIADLANALADRIAPVLTGLHDRLDELEGEAAAGAGQKVRNELNDIRGQIIALRRFISPQQAALSQLSVTTLGWFPDDQRMQIRAALDDITRHVEDLDSLRDSAGIIRDEISNAISERLNSNMYVLAIISVVFLPLSFLTGLLGINVAGIPGSEYDNAFLIVCGLIVAGGLAQIAILKWRGWF